MDESLGSRIAFHRKRLGLSQAQLADKVGLKQQTIGKLEEGRQRSTTKMVSLAEVLEVDPKWLETGEGSHAAKSVPARPVPDDAMTNPEHIPIPPIAGLPNDLPVYGVAVGGLDAEFYFNGTIVEYRRRPIGLASVPDAFGVYVVGSSMSPKFEEGELVFIHPRRPPRNGDYVLIEMLQHGDADNPEAAGRCFIKRLLKRTPNSVVCEQFNPARNDISFDVSDVRHVYRIMTAAELMDI